MWLFVLFVIVFVDNIIGGFKNENMKDLDFIGKKYKL